LQRLPANQIGNIWIAFNNENQFPGCHIFSF
jgi:hypothetical protein